MSIRRSLFRNARRSAIYSITSPCTPGSLAARARLSVLFRANSFLQVAGSQSAYALCCALLAGRAMPDRLASGIFSFEASTKTAPGLRPSSAAISLAGNLPAILLSLAISSSLHGRLESGIRDTPFRTFHKIGNFRKSSRDRGRLIYSLAGQVSIRSIAPDSNEAVQ